MYRSAAAQLVVLAGASACLAQWDPNTGKWGKTDPRDVRVMTWNVRDSLCRTETKDEGLLNWCALARTVAAMKPDILVLQECGDNSGNGSGSGVDSVSQLTTVMGLFFDGGTDPFRGNVAVTSWVKKYDVNYDLNHVFVSSVHDGFNRNVIVSRWPFADLNGDTLSTYSDTPFMLPDAYMTSGGTGEIRGLTIAEINLPDESYGGNLVCMTSHLKSGSDTDSKNQRITASQNIAYFIDYWYNGAGTGIPDPNSKIFESPAATMILEENTPVIWGGDLNEDENTNGRKGPAEWTSRAGVTGGTDGTDRDRSDSSFDASVEFFGGSRATQSSSKLDYLLWQDSIAVLRRSFVFDSGPIPSGKQPPELNGFPAGYDLVTGFASDHKCVVADFILPEPAVDCPADWNDDGTVDAFDYDDFVSAYFDYVNNGVGFPDFNQDGYVDAFDYDDFTSVFFTPCP